MVLVIVILVGVAGSVGVGLVTLLGYGCWRWFGPWGAGAIAAVLGLASILGAWSIHTTAQQARNADEQAVSGLFNWAVGVPTVGAVAAALWLARLALNR